MKNLIAFSTILCLFGLLSAQNPSKNLMSQSKFNVSDVNWLDHLLLDDFTDIQVNLKSRTLRIDDASYKMKSIGIESYLIDEDQKFYAYTIGRKIEVGGKTYVMKSGKLLSEQGEIICKAYTRTAKGNMFLGISRSAEVSDLIVGLFYYSQLLKIAEGGDTDYAYLDLPASSQYFEK